MSFRDPIRPPFDRDEIPVYGDWYTFRSTRTVPHSFDTRTQKIPMPKLDRQGRLLEGPNRGLYPDPFFGPFANEIWRFQELSDDPNWEIVNVQRNRLISIPENQLVVYTVTNSGYRRGDGWWEEFSEEVYGGLGQSDDDVIRSVGEDPNDTGYYYGGQGHEEKFSVAETPIPISDIPSDARFVQPSER